jgi:hypothetical protein
MSRSFRKNAAAKTSRGKRYSTLYIRGVRAARRVFKHIDIEDDNRFARYYKCLKGRINYKGRGDPAKRIRQPEAMRK